MGQYDLGGIMNDKVKSYLQSIYGYRWMCIIVGIVILLTCIWFYTNKSSNIDTTGIQRATTEVDNARQYNRRAVEESMNLIKEQRAQLIEAKNSLEQQERTLTMQSESLAKVNAYLEMQTRELQKVKMQQRNSKLLNILLGGAVVYLAAKN